MSTLKVVKDAQGRTVGFGPNADFYEPSIPDGGSLEYGDTAEMYVPPPLPIEEIRAIERTPAVADAMQRASRLVALSYAQDDLIRIAASKGQTVTRQQAHDWAMLNDSNYKTLYDAEQIIKPLRALV
ncbi:hypothetical protein [Polaromonas sp. YR568]|uniref:hypothetical protein n=1 Tax=Polaromonas sp. YR568 TaxID=1855301 RepID=UPI003138009A